MHVTRVNLKTTFDSVVKETVVRMLQKDNVESVIVEIIVKIYTQKYQAFYK